MIRPPQSRAEAPHKCTERGAALIIVLSMLVLMVGLILAFFSSSLLYRQLSSSSASVTRSELFIQSATDMVIADFLEEIAAGSNVDGFTPPAGVASTKIFQPIPVTTGSTTLSPSIVPQRVADDGIASIVKKSKSGSPFFAIVDGYRSSYPAGATRAAAVSSTSAALGGLKIPRESWNRPRLMTAKEAGISFNAPDWIYLDREGKNPVSFEGAMLKELSSSASDNPRFVLGRYAYVVYDVGGLIDINVVGNALPEGDNQRRGRLHQVNLTAGIGETVMAQFDKLIAWRWPKFAQDASLSGNGLFSPARSFLEVPAGEQIFVNRHDLLRFSARSGSPIPEAALPFLTTFNIDLNAPHFRPEPSRPKLPASPDPDVVNPNILGTAERFVSRKELSRGGSGGVTVEAGTPVMPRRFPLSKLNLFSESSPNVDQMAYYFGLQKESDGSWRYIAQQDGRIARLNEVAAMGREPNFFEVLQAVIYAGSLGKEAGDTILRNSLRDRRADLQVMQIGANIIDQWDGDDLPTTLIYPSGTPSDPHMIYGIENLPYINNMALAPHRPEYDRNRLQIWALFDVWNPHQNARTPPQGISQFRIVPVSGRGKVTTRYSVHDPDTTYSPLFNSEDVAELGSSNQVIATLNAGHELSFPADPDSPAKYSEPTVIGGQKPMSDSDTPGILLGQLTNLKIAIPARASRKDAIQNILNDLVEQTAPYTALDPQGGTASYTSVGGNRIYPSDTTFVNLMTNFWARSDTPEGIVLSANYGVKAHNWVRFSPDAGNPVKLALQAKVGSQWRTYQVIEGWTESSGSILHGIDVAEPGKPSQSTSILVNTHHSASDADLKTPFYAWGTESVVNGFVKYDPRSVRFGFSTNLFTNPLGFSLRTTAEVWDGTKDEAQTSWRLLRGTPLAGMPDGVPGFGFERWRKAGNTLKQAAPFGLVSNYPEGPVDAVHPYRYSDLDGVIRPGDGYRGALPTVPGHFADRALILNRPFRSVGELGYAFRDLPWKTLDFFSRYSGDLNLLDAFSLDETPEPLPMMAGKVNLNTRRPEVLEALLRGSAKQLAGMDVGMAGAALTATEAKELATQIVAESKAAPFFSKGDLVARVFDKAGSTSPVTDSQKVRREAAIRTLAEMGTTRTWNFLIDIVSQSGRFTASSKKGEDFVVRVQQRQWVHVSIDRFTGEILAIRREAIHE